MAMTQLNTRIDEHLKAAGDAVLAKEHRTSSELVREVWKYMALTGQLPPFAFDGAVDAVDVAHTGEGGAGQSAAATAVERFFLDAGLHVPAGGDVDLDALREEAALERLAKWESS